MKLSKRSFLKSAALLATGTALPNLIGQVRKEPIGLET
jgi:hypothetical protein